jgi:thymidine kinase
MRAKFFFYYGTMESAKSAMLLIEAHNFEKRGIGILCMKPSIDDRDGSNIIHSRIGIEKECLPISEDYNIFECVRKCIAEAKENEDVQPLQWVLVDESQFLTTQQVEDLRLVVDKLNINVICYGLRTDFQTFLFEGSKRLFELADEISELKTSCSCGKKAIINARFNNNGEIVINGEQILIGGEDTYKPMCSKCFLEAIEKQNTINEYDNSYTEVNN